MEPKLVVLFLEAQVRMFFHLVNPILILILQREPHVGEAKKLTTVGTPIGSFNMAFITFFMT